MENEELWFGKYCTQIFIAEYIYKNNLENFIVVKVNDNLWHLKRPLTHDCNLQYLIFDDSDGKKVFWNSSVYLFVLCCKKVFNGQFDHGSITNERFYYDMKLNIQPNAKHFKGMNKIVNKLIDKIPFHPKS